MGQQVKIRDNEKKKTITSAVWGGLLIALILLVTTLWVSNGARVGTSQAVNRVSEFYLEELAGRRAQVVSEELKSNISYMENALAIMEESDLASQESLRHFLGRVKRLYGLDKIALVDENGIVYTEHSTTSGLSRYSFLSEEMTGPVTSTANLYGARKQVVLAIPVEGISFQGSRVTASFIQINIDEMLSSLTLQASNNETYCNIYHRSGESLTNDKFGNMEPGSNLFSAVRDADNADGTDHQQLIRDFENGNPGQISFNYKGFQEDLCYVPVEGTNWMLAILIRDNVISEQISSISSGMMTRGIIQIIITVFAMLLVFHVLTNQSKKHSRILLEQEKEDGNRIRALSW